MTRIYNIVANLIKNYKTVKDEDGLKDIIVYIEALYSKGKITEEEYNNLKEMLSDNKEG